MPNIPEHIKKVIDEFVKGANGILGDRVKKIILYGSYARGDYNEGADVDIMILTEDEMYEYEKKVCDFAYDIECEHNFKVDLSPTLKNIDTFNYWLDTLPFYMNVQKEGVILNE